MIQRLAKTIQSLPLSSLKYDELYWRCSPETFAFYIIPVLYRQSGIAVSEANDRRPTLMGYPVRFESGCAVDFGTHEVRVRLN